MEQGTKGDFALSPFLNLLLQDAADSCFGGVAMAAQEDGAYRISETVNPEHSQMAGAEFRIGEGFLGQGAMVGDVLSWKEIEHDPRSQFFAAFGIEPRSLVCVPIEDDQHHVIGLIFWGSCSRKREAPPIVPSVRVLGKLYGMLQSARNVEQAYRTQKIYLSSLIEITRLVHRIHDLKRLLAVLVDISINLIDEARSSLFMFKVPGKSKASIVSRGMTQERAQRYSQELISRYLDNPGSAGEPVLGETFWGEISIECPIRCHGAVQGALCVFLPRSRGAEDYLDVFQAFMTLANMAIEQAVSRDAENEMDRGVAMLFESMGYWNAEKHQLHARARELAAEFAAGMLPEPESVSLISSACLVCAYPPDLLKAHLEQHAGLIDLVAEFQEYRKGGGSSASPPGTACQVMALAFAYLEEHENPDALHRLEAIPASMRDAFIRFVHSRLTAEFETELERKPDYADASLHLTDLTRAFKLSSREQEVYELVVNGLNNREIAEALFISEHTVKNHITNLFQKLNVSDRAQAIALAYRSTFN
jgi:DNA-binding CsgD family transcriptional regulator